MREEKTAADRAVLKPFMTDEHGKGEMVVTSTNVVMLVPGEAGQARELKVRRKGNLLKMANPAVSSRAPEHQWNFHGTSMEALSSVDREHNTGW